VALGILYDGRKRGLADGKNNADNDLKYN